MPGTSASRTLLVLYRRAVGLNTESDPRDNVLRVDERWLLHPEMSLGFGRAPAGVDIAVRLTSDTGESDTSIPRLAGRIATQASRWTVTNHATGSTKLFLTAPGLYREIIRQSPAEILIRDSQMVSLRSRDGDIEHRFHLVTRWSVPATSDGLDPPEVHWEPGDWETGAPTTATADDPGWHAGDRRTLAAYCYPELRGLLSRQRERTAQTLLLLGRPPTKSNQKWLEKQLRRLRADAGKRLGIDLHGEGGTPLFIGYVVTHRALLGPALREIDGPVTVRLSAAAAAFGPDPSDATPMPAAPPPTPAPGGVRPPPADAETTRLPPAIPRTQLCQETGG
ncbi:hypothetical protein [Parafrankia sp. FMc2]|uniref:hypothetical protein n=1 Tax=Parafrankia sp. FMc2 TaxID=3233196 RepID=UPI0034D3F8A7